MRLGEAWERGWGRAPGTRLGESPGNEAGGEPRERGWGRAPGIRLEEKPGNEVGRGLGMRIHFYYMAFSSLVHVYAHFSCEKEEFVKFQLLFSPSE